MLIYKKQRIDLNVVLALFVDIVERTGFGITPKRCAKLHGGTPYYWTKCLNALVEHGAIA